MVSINTAWSSNDVALLRTEMTTSRPSLIEASSTIIHRILVALEGNPGTGKSTVARRLSTQFGATVFHFPPAFVRFREEAELDATVSPHPRLFYYLAATLHLGQLVDEALAAGPVICDRYASSPIALLLADGAVSPQEVERWWDPHESEMPVPAVTVYLHCDYQVARERITQRATAGDGRLNSVNARVVASPYFYETMAQTLRRRVERFGPVSEIDTTDLSEVDVLSIALSAIQTAHRVAP